MSLTLLQNPWLSSVGLCLAILASSCAEESETVVTYSAPIVFGNDDRTEAYVQTPGTIGEEVASSSVALVDTSRLGFSNSDFVQWTAPTLQDKVKLCSGERFAEQPTLAFCSATIIAPDLLLTAGHCVNDSNCPLVSAVTHYEMTASDTLGPMTSGQVYSCKEIVVRAYSAEVDYAILRLDRPITGAVPAKVKVGPLPLTTDQQLVATGYPSGLPLKIAGDARVTEPRARLLDYFSSDIDSFTGNSGGGVFLADTGELAGVIARGPTLGYTTASGESCTRPETGEVGKSLPIESTYVHHAISAYCAKENNPDLCACGDGTCDLVRGESTATCAEDCGSQCGDSACNGTEDGNSCYSDCGWCGNAICENSELLRMDCAGDCGCPPGFTPEVGACLPKRGNVNGDGVIDERDVIALRDSVRHLRAPRANLSSADVDCNGQVDLRDEVALAKFTRHGGYLPCDNAQKIQAGTRSTCMLSESGGVRCWGENNFGQLGASHSNRIGDNESAFAAASVELGTSAVQLSVGSTHGCALLSNHDVTCWGEGTNGQLGYGNTNNIGDDEPVSVAGAVQLSGKARQVVVGGSHSCAIIDEGQVQCWGSNEFGQLGNGQPGSVGDDETPASVSPLRFALPIKQLALGFDFSCALDIVGNVYCWGENYFGQLGRGDWLQGSDSYEMANDLSPIALGGSTEQIFTGPTGVCALRTDGALYCWGDNSMGQIGYDQFDAIGDDEFPVDVGALPIGSGIKSVALGMSHSCALFHDGTVKCWGDNSDGQLGLDGGNSTGLTAAAVEAMPVSLGGVASDIASGSGFSCAVLVTGGVRCWGANDAGQLGRGNTTNIGLNETPAVVGDVPMSYVSAATWQFVNPKDLTVWLSVPSSRGSTTAISLALSSPKRHVVEALKAFYNFQIAIPEKGTPKLFDWDTPFSTPQIESGEGNAFSIVFNYSSVGSVEVGREHHLRRRVERVGLGVGSLESGGNGQNDYGLSDRASSCAWYQTQRIQIADASGRLVYGWTPR